MMNSKSSIGLERQPRPGNTSKRADAVAAARMNTGQQQENQSEFSNGAEQVERGPYANPGFRKAKITSPGNSEDASTASGRSSFAVMCSPRATSSTLHPEVQVKRSRQPRQRTPFQRSRHGSHGPAFGCQHESLTQYAKHINSRQ